METGTVLNVLDLFSGIGGFSLGLERTGGFRTVAFCELRRYRRGVLRKHWPRVPCFRDVRFLTGGKLARFLPIDVVTGGFPCQATSLAGKRMGNQDDRWLWPEYRRLVEELRPAWVIGENPLGLVSMGLDQVLADLESLGYAWRAFVIPACAIGLDHRRERVWIVANSYGIGQQRERTGRNTGASKGDDARGEIAGSPSTRSGGLWPTEPLICGRTNGIPYGVDRISALGDSLVPQIPEIIGRAILKVEEINQSKTK